MKKSVATPKVSRKANDDVVTARAAILRYLAINGTSWSAADREDIGSEALENWRTKGKTTAIEYAKRALLNAARKKKRRATSASDAIERASEMSEDALIDFVDEADASASPKARKPRVARFKRSEDAQLKAAVRAECLKQFRVRLGEPGVWSAVWRPELERSVLSIPDDSRDFAEAYEIHEELRIAMARAVEFVHRERPPYRAAAPLGLAWWVPQFIEPLTRHSFMLPSAPEESRGKDWRDHSSARHRLVATWDSYDFLGFRRPDGGGARILNAREFALIWLLGGGWPENLQFAAAGRKAVSVIEAEERNFRAAIAEVGRGWVRGPIKTGDEHG